MSEKPITETFYSHEGKLFNEALSEISRESLHESISLGREILILPAPPEIAEKLAFLAWSLLHAARMNQVLDDLRVETITLRMTLASLPGGREMLAERALRRPQ